VREYEEENTNLALEIRENFIDGIKTIVIPDLSIYEIANALRYNQNLTKIMNKQKIGQNHDSLFQI